MQQSESSEDHVRHGGAAERTESEGLYPIRTVSALTGINPVTLRAWERRYGLIRPQRTPKGHRLYTEADIERVHRILELQQQGIPIGQTRRLIDSNVAPVHNHAPSDSEDPWGEYRMRALEALAGFDLVALESIYNDALSLFPIDLVHERMIAPLARDMTRRSATGDPAELAQAHFLNAFMRNKLGARFHHRASHARGPRLVFAGLPGEWRETELLLLGLAAMDRGYRIVLLGADVPPKAMATAADTARARAVVVFGATRNRKGLDHDLRELADAVDVPVFVGGADAEQQRDAIDGAGAIPLPANTGQALACVYARLGNTEVT